MNLHQRITVDSAGEEIAGSQSHRLSGRAGAEGTSRVCIVVRDLFGDHWSNDASANMLGMAQRLAEQGNRVTVVWVPPESVERNYSIEAKAAIVDKYAERFLIELVILNDVPELSPHLSFPEKAALATYYYLKRHVFDELYFALEGGLGYYTLLARELGLYNPAAAISVVAHSPTEWITAADRRFLSSIPELSVIHMEKYCIENGEHVLFCSRHIEQWCVSKGWALPDNRATVPILLPDELSVAPVPGGPSRTGMVNLGFWPGHEYRNGITRLCDALDILADAGTSNVTLNFFGSFDKVLGEHTGGMIIRRARRWPFAIRFFPHATERQGLEYLQSRGGIGVFPEIDSPGSRLVLGCLEAGIPVIASRAGANPELVKKASASAFCEPTAKSLARSIRSLIGRRTKPAIAVPSQQERAERWSRIRNQMRKASARPQPRRWKPDRQPLVSIVIAHHERPRFLSDALQSVLQQDYPSLEVVLVDDGSRSKEAKAFLKKLEPGFKRRRWKIIRQKNKYLGAARNAGIRASRGRYVLFLDDDNALLHHAVSTFVKSMETSGADICTSVSKIFVGSTIPKNESEGFVEYVPLGGSLDLGLLFDSFGDANAMIRREVFDKIGYLNEQHGFAASDWEFFARAVLAGMKLRIIPEPTYWYRSSAQGMFRSSTWYDIRLPMLKLFAKHEFKGLSHVHEMLIAQNAYWGERDSLGFALRFDPANEAMQQLGNLPPNSHEARQKLAEIAASEGRPDTALTLLAESGDKTLSEKAWKAWLSPSLAQSSLANEPLPPAYRHTLGYEVLRNFAVGTTKPGQATPRSFVTQPGRLTIESVPGNDVVAVLGNGIPPGTISLSLRCAIDEAAGGPVQVMLSVIDPGAADRNNGSAMERRAESPVIASSGWIALDRPYVEQPMDVQLSIPTETPASLVLSVREARRFKNTPGTLVRFESITHESFVGQNLARRPRLEQPSSRPRARELATAEVETAFVASRHPGEGQLLFFDKEQKGFSIRPSNSGLVVVAMQWAFPPFAKGLVGSVEIADDSVSGCDFALALARPSYPGTWTSGGPQDALAFSGWRRVTRKFELVDIEVALEQPHRFHLAICAAIRLPAGEVPKSDALFWRKFAVRW